MTIKRKTAIIVIFLAAAMSAGCSSPAVSNNKKAPAVIEAQKYNSVGVIKSVDIDSDRVTVDHEEIPGYMSAMEMNAIVADHEMLGSIKVGDKVEFEIERKGSTIVYTKFTIISHVAILDGAAIFKTNCVACHGGNGEGAPKGIPLISGHALDHTEAEYAEQVKNGKTGKMPAFHNKLTTEQIAAVVSFVRNTIQANISPEMRIGHHH